MPVNSSRDAIPPRRHDGRSRRRAQLSRRDFLALAAAGLVTGCSTGTPQIPSATATPVLTSGPTTAAPVEDATPTPRPTAVPTATLTPLPDIEVRRPDLIQRYPDGVSRVVHAHHDGAWRDGALAPEALGEMLASSITALTGMDDARAAWASLFSPDERVAIKVNAFRNSIIWTHVPLVTAVTGALQDAGVLPEHILIFDYYTSELVEAGFAVNRDGPGVRCFGTDADYSAGFEVADYPTKLSNCLLGCHALINMPVLKSHMIAGLTFALKNHYGTIPNPEAYHYGARMEAGMAQLNALPPIKDRTRLVIGDALTACLRYGNSWPYWESDYTGDAILMSFDPVAADAVALELLASLLEADGGNAAALRGMAEPWLASSRAIGLGTSHLDEIDLVELSL